MTAKKWKDSAQEVIRTAAGTLESAVKNAKDGYDQSTIKEKVDQTQLRTRELLNETGITQYAEMVTNATTNQLDTISGTKMLALVEERLEIQSRYNDILAAKLEEALARIAVLEQKIKAKNR